MEVEVEVEVEVEDRGVSLRGGSVVRGLPGKWTRWRAGWGRWRQSLKSFAATSCELRNSSSLSEKAGNKVSMEEAA